MPAQAGSRASLHINEPEASEGEDVDVSGDMDALWAASLRESAEAEAAESSAEEPTKDIWETQIQPQQLTRDSQHDTPNVEESEDEDKGDSSEDDSSGDVPPPLSPAVNVNADDSDDEPPSGPSDTTWILQRLVERRQQVSNAGSATKSGAEAQSPIDPVESNSSDSAQNNSLAKDEHTDSDNEASLGQHVLDMLQPATSSEDSDSESGQSRIAELSCYAGSADYQ